MRLLCSARTGPDAAPRLLAALPNESSRIDQIAEALAQIGRPVAPTAHAGRPVARCARVRRGAALALGQVRPPAPGTVSALTAGLDDPDSAVKSAFLSAIGYLGSRAHEAVPSVRAQLHDKSSEIRLKAIQILAQSAPRDERLVTDMIAVLDDSVAKVQRASHRCSSFPGPARPPCARCRHRQVEQQGPGRAVRGRGDGRQSRPGRRRGGPGAGQPARRSGAETSNDRRPDAGDDGQRGTTRAGTAVDAPGRRTGRGSGSGHGDAGKPGAGPRRRQTASCQCPRAIPGRKFAGRP